MRLFIAFDPGDAIKKRIAEEIKKLSAIDSGIKWVEGNNLHLTLKFLGWVEDKNLEKIRSLTEESIKGRGSFKVKFAGMGSFPQEKSPRVFWIGISEGGEKLKQIADKLEDDLSRAGFRSEDREFSAHLTIGRVKEKKGVDKVKEKMCELEKQTFGEILVANINIMKSTLTQKGPTYEIYHQVHLG